MPGENVTADDVLFFKGQLKRDADALKMAQTARKKTRQRAKLIGIQIEVLDAVIKAEGEDDDTTLERMKTFAKYAQFVGLPVGFQFNFFGEHAEAGRPREDQLEAARRVGHEHGVLGSPRDEQAYPPLTEIGMAYAEGYDEGQDINKQKFLELNGAGGGDSEPRRGRPKGSKNKTKSADGVHAQTEDSEEVNEFGHSTKTLDPPEDGDDESAGAVH